MARILAEVPIKEETIVCKDGCRKTVAYVPNDVSKSTSGDYGGGSTTYERIVCPGCGKPITVKVW